MPEPTTPPGGSAPKPPRRSLFERLGRWAAPIADDDDDGAWSASGLLAPESSDPLADAGRAQQIEQLRLMSTGDSSDDAWELRGEMMRLGATDADVLDTLRGVDTELAWAKRDEMLVSANLDNRNAVARSLDNLPVTPRLNKMRHDLRLPPLPVEPVDPGTNPFGDVDWGTPRRPVRAPILGDELDDDRTIPSIDPPLFGDLGMPDTSLRAPEVVIDPAARPDRLINRVATDREAILNKAGVSYEELPEEFRIKLEDLDADMKVKAERLSDLRNALVAAERAIENRWFGNIRPASAALEDQRASAEREYNAARVEFVASNVKHYLAEQLAIGETRSRATAAAENPAIRTMHKVWDGLGNANLDTLFANPERSGWKKTAMRMMSLRTGVSVALLATTGGAIYLGAAAPTGLLTGAAVGRRVWGSLSSFLGTNNLFKGKTSDKAVGRISTMLDKHRADEPLTQIEKDALANDLTYMASAAALDGRTLLNDATYTKGLSMLVKEKAGERSAQVSNIMNGLDAKLIDGRKRAVKNRTIRRSMAVAASALVGSGLAGKAFAAVGNGIDNLTGNYASSLAHRAIDWATDSGDTGVAAPVDGVTPVPVVDTPGTPVSEMDMLKALGMVDGAPTGSKWLEMLSNMTDQAKDMYLIHAGEGISNPMYRQLLARATEFGYTGAVPTDISNLHALEGTPWKEWADKIVLDTLKETKMNVDGKLVSLWDASKNENVWALIKDRFGVGMDPVAGGKASLTLIDMDTKSVVPFGGSDAVNQNFDVSGTRHSMATPGGRTAPDAPNRGPVQVDDRIRVGKGGVAATDTPQRVGVRPGAEDAASSLAREMADKLPSGLTSEQIARIPVAEGAAPNVPTDSPSGGSAVAGGASVEKPVITGGAAEVAVTDTVTISPSTPLDFSKAYGQVVGYLNGDLGTEVGKKIVSQQGLLFERGTSGSVLVSTPGSSLDKVTLTTQIFKALREIVPADAGTSISAADFDAAIRSAQEQVASVR